MDPDDMIIDDAPLVLPTDAMHDVEDGELNPTEVCPNKVFITGLNEQVFNQNVLDYIKTHYPSEEFEKIEWINDHSVNVVYSSDIAAAEALEAFSTQSISDQSQLRPARAIPTLPEIELTARLSTINDVKRAGAAAASRFYLQNPDEDPTNRPLRRKKRQNGGRGPVERSDLHRYRARDYEDKAPAAGLNYDDEPTEERGGRRDILDKRPYGRLRDRSASPIRDGDGRNGFPEEQPYRRTARARSRSPRRGRDNRAARDLLANDLFSKEAKTAATGERNTARELFPDKAGHRRQDAQHLSSAEVAHAIGRYHLASPPREDDPAPIDLFPKGRPSASRDLFARIESVPGKRTSPTYGRLNSDADTTSGGGGQGFSIRGAGASAERGFSILGASRENSRAKAIELYPHKIAAAASGNQQQQQHQQRQQRRITAHELI